MSNRSAESRPLLPAPALDTNDDLANFFGNPFWIPLNHITAILIASIGGVLPELCGAAVEPYINGAIYAVRIVTGVFADICTRARDFQRTETDGVWKTQRKLRMEWKQRNWMWILLYCCGVVFCLLLPVDNLSGLKVRCNLGSRGFIDERGENYKVRRYTWYYDLCIVIKKMFTIGAACFDYLCPSFHRKETVTSALLSVSAAADCIATFYSLRQKAAWGPGETNGPTSQPTDIEQGRGARAEAHAEAMAGSSSQQGSMNGNDKA